MAFHGMDADLCEAPLQCQCVLWGREEGFQIENFSKRRWARWVTLRAALSPTRPQSLFFFVFGNLSFHELVNQFSMSR